jgi:hypothetical protein
LPPAWPTEEAREARGRGVGHRLHPQPAEPPAPRLAAATLNGARDHRLARSAAAGLAGSGAADQRLVGLDPQRQGLASRPDHRAADLVEPAVP